MYDFPWLRADRRRKRKWQHAADRARKKRAAEGGSYYAQRRRPWTREHLVKPIGYYRFNFADYLPKATE